MTKKRPRPKSQPVDVDAVLAQAAAERNKADPYYSSYRRSWETVPDEPVVVRRYVGPSANRFTSARSRKAAKAAEVTASRQGRRSRDKTAKKSA